MDSRTETSGKPYMYYILLAYICNFCVCRSICHSSLVDACLPVEGCLNYCKSPVIYIMNQTLKTVDSPTFIGKNHSTPQTRITSRLDFPIDICVHRSP